MYEKTIWVDQNVERPKTYEFSQNEDGSYAALDAFGEVTELGTPVNAQNMNHIEEGISSNDLRITALENKDEVTGFSIGQPIVTLAGTLGENEIWLEGAEVSKTTYAALYEIYGDTYGTAASEDNFVLPDFRGRAIWGTSSDDGFGYIEAGLPNISGTFSAVLRSGAWGCFSYSGSATDQIGDGGINVNYAAITTLNASASSSIYGKSSTVQPPAIKTRVKTRYA